MQVFISYARQDKDQVKSILELTHRFLFGTMRVWIDEIDLHWGDEIDNGIKKAITNDCLFMLIFLSRHAMQRDWVKKELELGLARERELARVFVLPILLECIDDEVLNVFFGWPGDDQQRHYLRIGFDKKEGYLEELGREIAKGLLSHVIGLVGPRRSPVTGDQVRLMEIAENKIFYYERGRPKITMEDEAFFDLLISDGLRERFEDEIVLQSTEFPPDSARKNLLRSDVNKYIKSKL